MVATVDIGNSNIAIGIFDRETLIHHWRVTTRTSMTADECEITLSALLAKDRVDPGRIETTVVSCVVPALTQPVSAAVESLTGTAPLVVTAGLDVGLSFATENPRELGSDLFANAVAGWTRYQKACVVVDFGTALTLTAVSADGVIQGVAIAPGLSTAISALSANTAQLPTVNLDVPVKAIGTNTVTAIQSGIMYGYQGLVDNLVDRFVKELDGTVRVVATGGQSTVMAPQCSRIEEIDPWLTLDGLRRISTIVRARQERSEER